MYTMKSDNSVPVYKKYARHRTLTAASMECAGGALSAVAVTVWDRVVVMDTVGFLVGVSVGLWVREREGVLVTVRAAQGAKEHARQATRKV